MTFIVKIKNIGKLADAEIRIGEFTVLAGPNNTGKSFVSKILYSLFNAMNANHAETHINNLVKPIYRDLNRLKRLTRQVRSDDVTSWLYSLETEIEKLVSLVKEASIDEFDNEDTISDLISQMENIEKIAADVPQFLSPKKMTERGQIYLNNLTNSLVKLKEELHQTNAKKFIVAGIEYEIRQNLIRNFQVPNFSYLRGTERTPSGVEVEDFAKFALSDEAVGFDIDSFWITQWQQYSSVIYLESPVYWKLKNALEDARDYPGYLHGHRDRERLSGVPGYFYDLARALRFEYTGEVAFPDVYARLTGENVIGGRVTISETGDLSFEENGRSFSLPVTAIGIANLGILALLIERKVLDEGSFLFMDEPEAHLHPAWQVIMAESLFELSRQGVNVVIATHSVDILQWLEVHVKKNPEDEQRIALNQFPASYDNAEDDFETKMGKITHELTKPFSDLYLEGL